MKNRMQFLTGSVIGAGITLGSAAAMTQPGLVAGIGAQSSAAAPKDTATGPATVATRIGNLEFTHDFANGYPAHATVDKLYDEMDFQRACQAYLWALPIVSFAQWQRAHEVTFGAGQGGIVSYTSYDDKLGILTANATTPYLLAFANLAETGALVVDLPPQGIYGGFSDFWQRPIPEVDPPGRGKELGSKYLLLGPGQEQPNAQGYRTLRSSTNNVFFGCRILTADPKEAKALRNRVRVYPFSKRGNAPATRILTPGGKAWSAMPPRGLPYWERLAEILNKESIQERDRFFMAMLKPLGIEHGKPFAPDERQTKILTEAALVGEAMAKANTFDKRAGEPYYPSARWKLALIMDPSQRTANYDQLDERAAWFYEAVTASRQMATQTPGVGSIYLAGYKDRDGAWLDGGSSYRLRVPPHVPAKQFWSVTVYDVDTRCFIKNKEKIADRSSRMDLIKDEDGSVNIYFGPSAPAGFENNWIPTVPGKGWFTYFRLFAPTEPYFDKTWKLNDIEKVQ